MIALKEPDAERPEPFPLFFRPSAQNVSSPRRLYNFLIFIRPSKALSIYFNHSVLDLAVSTIKKRNWILPCYSPSMSSVQASDKHI